MEQKKVRGLAPEDNRFFSESGVKKLGTAQEELYFLLNRGYPMKSAVTLVGNHHQLAVRQILALTRATAPAGSLENRESKRLHSKDMRGKTVYLDGFNLIITLEVALSGGMLFVGQDGCVRDLAELRGTYRLISQTETAVQILRDALQELGVSKAVFYLDQPVSNSGRLKTKIAEADWAIPLDVQIVRSPDALLKQLDCVITADAIILDECKSWYNIMPHLFAHRRELQGLERLIRLVQKI